MAATPASRKRWRRNSLSFSEDVLEAEAKRLRTRRCAGAWPREHTAVGSSVFIIAGAHQGRRGVLLKDASMRTSSSGAAISPPFLVALDKAKGSEALWFGEGDFLGSEIPVSELAAWSIDVSSQEVTALLRRRVDEVVGAMFPDDLSEAVEVLRTYPDDFDAARVRWARSPTPLVPAFLEYAQAADVAASIASLPALAREAADALAQGTPTDIPEALRAWATHRPPPGPRFFQKGNGKTGRFPEDKLANMLYQRLTDCAGAFPYVMRLLQALADVAGCQGGAAGQRLETLETFDDDTPGLAMEAVLHLDVRSLFSLLPQDLKRWTLLPEFSAIRATNFDASAKAAASFRETVQVDDFTPQAVMALAPVEERRFSEKAGHLGYCKQCKMWLRKGRALRPADLERCVRLGCGPEHPWQRMPHFKGKRPKFQLQASRRRGEDGSETVRLRLSAQLRAILADEGARVCWPADETCVAWRLAPADAARHTEHRLWFDAPWPKPTDVGAAVQFRLHSTSSELCAPQPPGFLLPLKPLQRQTFGWMLFQEGVLEKAFGGGPSRLPEFLSTTHVTSRFGQTDVCLELRVERLYNSVSGGVLCDNVGYGKTACVLALIAATRHLHMGPAPGRPVRDAAAWAPCFISSRATLVLVPANLFEQWLRACKKFLGDDGLKVVAIPAAHSAVYSKLSVRELAEADIVLISYRFFFSDFYRKRCDKLAGVTLAKQQRRISASEQWCKAKYAWEQQNPETRGPCPVVSDFSDIVQEYQPQSREYHGQRVERMRAHTAFMLRAHPTEQLLNVTGSLALEMFAWRRVVYDEFHEAIRVRAGLSNNEGIAFNALRNLKAERRWGLTATPDLTSAARVSAMAGVMQVFVDPDDGEAAQNFLNHFARSNNWDVDSVPLEEHVVEVKLTQNERALYLNELNGQALHGGRGVSEASAKERLLKRCSDFMPDEQAEDSRRAMEAVRERQHAHAREARQRLEQAEEELSKLKVLADEARLVQEELPAELKEELAKQGRSVGQLKRTAENADSQCRFFESVITALRTQQDEPGECSICLGDMTPETTGILPCGHCFHEECVKTALVGNAQCPECRRATPVSDVLKGQSILSQDEDTGSRDSTKIASVVDQFRRLRAEDPTAKIIVFVQWEALLAKVNVSLADAGCQCLQLRGSVFQRSQTLRQFEDSPAAEHAVLLLSLEKSPTGMNLTVANHVFLLHPMLAENVETAIGYERQAIGRVRRQGQAKTVHVWRFVTMDTIEEAMTTRHRQASASVSPAPGAVDLA